MGEDIQVYCFSAILSGTRDQKRRTLEYAWFRVGVQRMDMRWIWDLLGKCTLAGIRNLL